MRVQKEDEDDTLEPVKDTTDARFVSCMEMFGNLVTTNPNWSKSGKGGKGAKGKVLWCRCC